jgi:membrane-associated phospholipid phosphatase
MSMSATVEVGDDDASLNASNAAAALLLLGAAGLFAFIARRVTTKRTEALDQRAHEWVQAHRVASLDVAVKPVTLLSMPILVMSATAALAWWLHRDGRTRAATAIALTPLAAAAVGQSFTTFLAQRNPPDARDSASGEVSEPSFPSGHTTGVTAEGLAIAYVLLQEGLATTPIVTALVAWPVVVGATRLYRDRHWATDIVAGWTAGIGVAAASALLYRLTAPSPPVPPR